MKSKETQDSATTARESGGNEDKRTRAAARGREARGASESGDGERGSGSGTDQRPLQSVVGADPGSGLLERRLETQRFG